MDVIKKVKGIFNKEETKETPSAKLEALMKEKEEATKKGEPWVAVLDTKINEDNFLMVFLELNDGRHISSLDDPNPFLANYCKSSF